MKRISRVSRGAGLVLAAGALCVLATAEAGDESPVGLSAKGEAGSAPAKGKAPPKPDFPPFTTVSDGLEKVVSTADGRASLYTLYANRKDGRLLAELPKGYEKQLLMIAPTVASGDEQAGVMGGTLYAKWKRFGKKLALLEPDFVVRSTGDEQSKSSIEQLYTDRLILDVPIVSTGPGGGPVIDLKGCLLGQHRKFFGPAMFGYGPVVRQVRPDLATLEAAKAFPENIEVAYELPAADGRLTKLHYSIRVLPENPAFKPRVADSRIGYFNVYYNDLGHPGTDEPFTRYIARWHVEKADPRLAMSPPRQPIVWYVEHTTPVRYRRFVREGILEWNKAFEKIGIFGAVEVYQQDAATGAHMDKDPEDARYNFFRWNTSTQGYAIGPSRWDPRTGEILDADVVWHAGLTNGIMSMLKSMSADVAMQGMTPETLAWLDDHPEWDPRLRLAPAAERASRLGAHRRSEPRDLHALARGALGADTARLALSMDGRAVVQAGHACRIGEYLSMNVGLFAAGFEAGMLDVDPEEPMLDDLPEAFLGAMIKYIAAHEVGHTLGLQHNFGASTVRSLAEINSEAMAGEPTVGSVMEYAGVNINHDDGPVQGAYATPTIGPYDYWAIAFGYGDDEQRDAVLARVAEPDHVFLNDITTIGPDPRAQTWDLGADSLAFAESRMRIVRDLRARIVEDIVKDGQSWRRARDRYDALLSHHVLAVVVASRWIGGSYTNWDHKGDPGDRAPIEDVDADRQRRALAFIIENTLHDEAFGLTPDLLRRMGTQFWPDPPGLASVLEDPSYEVHDTVAGLQASALTLVMNPTRLRRLYDNEFRTAGDPDAITMAEVLGTVTDAVWSELDASADGPFTTADPMISSFRRNLQREHLERLIDLSMPNDAASPSMRTISTLSAWKLRQIQQKIRDVLEGGGRLDDYTTAHLADADTRIEKALDALYIYGVR